MYFSTTLTSLYLQMLTDVYIFTLSVVYFYSVYVYFFLTIKHSTVPILIDGECSNVLRLTAERKIPPALHAISHVI